MIDGSVPYVWKSSKMPWKLIVVIIYSVKTVSVKPSHVLCVMKESGQKRNLSPIYRLGDSFWSLLYLVKMNIVNKSLENVTRKNI